MLNEKEQALREQLGKSKYCDAAYWLQLHDCEKLESMIRDTLNPENELYFQLVSKGPLFHAPLDVLGIDIEKVVETTFIRRLSREKAVALATIMAENDMRIVIAGDVEIATGSYLLRRWNELHSDEEPIYKA